MTGPSSGLSSVACVTPVGGIVSITLGTEFGLSEQIGLGLPVGQTPNVNWPGVGVKPRTGGWPDP